MERMEGDGERLDQRRMFKGQGGGQPVQDVIRNRDIFRKSPMLTVFLARHPQDPAPVAQVNLPAAAKLASAAINR